MVGCENCLNLKKIKEQRRLVDCVKKGDNVPYHEYTECGLFRSKGNMK